MYTNYALSSRIQVGYFMNTQEIIYKKIFIPEHFLEITISNKLLLDILNIFDSCMTKSRQIIFLKKLFIGCVYVCMNTHAHTYQNHSHFIVYKI